MMSGSYRNHPQTYATIPSQNLPRADTESSAKWRQDQQDLLVFDKFWMPTVATLKR